MFEIKIIIDTPAEIRSDGMWVQIYKAFDENGERTHKIILDSESSLTCFVDEKEQIRIDCSVTMDDAYTFSKLQVNGQDIRTGEVLMVEHDIEIFAKSDFVNYKLYNNVANCVVKKDSLILQNNDIVHYGDILNIERFGGEIVINRKSYKSFPLQYSVFSDVVIK